MLVAVQLSPARVQIAAVCSTPDNHFTASAHCCVGGSGIRRSRRSRNRPTVGYGVVSSASVDITARTKAAPHNHFAAGPHCGMNTSRGGRAGRTCACPSIRAWIVFFSCVETVGTVIPAPDNHLSASPNSAVKGSGRRRVSRACGCPCVVDAPFRNLWKRVGYVG